MSESPATARFGVVALSGRPNAGKSTLLNRLVGEKVSIVTNRPQTTRTAITGIVHRPGAQLAVIDTPGIHRPLHRLNQRMMRAATAALHGVDVIVAVADAALPLGNGDRYHLDLLRQARTPVFLALNKIDTLRRPDLLPTLARWSAAFDFAEIHPISAFSGEGVEALLADLIARLPAGEAQYPEDAFTDLSERFLVAEIVREKLILATREEIPHATTVTIDDWEEPPEAERVLHIQASILVERSSQKGIVIGKGGALLKRIGTEARVELEALLGRRVFLGLQVRVREGWRDDERLLDRLGLSA